MNYVRRIYLLVPLLLGGCAVGYTLVAPGMVAVEDLSVRVDQSWNRAPSTHVAMGRHGAEGWTHDGMLLDHLVIIPAVPDGEPIFFTRERTAALPVFRADMLPNELEELVESSLGKYFGEGQAVVNTENLRPFRFGDQRGVRFEFNATVTDSPEYRGTVGAFIANEKLYVMFFLAAVPHYYDKHIAAAQAVIESARIGGMSPT